MSSGVLELGLVEAARLLGAGEVSPVELTEAALDRIEELDEDLGAFVTVAPERARAAAREAQREIAAGDRRGALHGIPVAVKDLIAVEGLPRTAGSAAFGGLVSESDAAVVERLERGGAVLVGTTSLDELAFATTGTGIVNPVDPGRSAGGSSGGSAVAVAARTCWGALGTDTGGSVRIPAACCDVVGVKPSYGSVDLSGVVPLAWSIDHIGAFGRSVDDAAAVSEALLPMPRRQELGDLEGLRVGIPGEGFLAVAGDEVRSAFERAVGVLSGRGAIVSEVELHDSDVPLNLQYLTALPEAASYHLSGHPDRVADYGEGVRAALAWGADVGARDYIDAQRVRTSVGRRVEDVLTTVDCIALPTMPIVPPAVGQEEVVLGTGRREDAVSAMLRYTCMFNHTGHPAVSVPVSAEDPGVGLQLVGEHGGEGPLLDVAAAYERAVR